MKKFLDALRLIFIAYPLGFLVGLWFWSFTLLGFLQVSGWWENFPHWKKRVIIISNHPYKGEQFLLTGLFALQYFFRPFTFGPYSVADLNNYLRKRRYRWTVGVRMVAVDRSGKGDPKAALAIKDLLERDKCLVWFPEGGRTEKGTPDELLYSRKGKKLRMLKEGFARLSIETDATIVPVWFEYDSWRKMRLVIGQPKQFSGMTSAEAVKKTEEIILALADRV